MAGREDAREQVAASGRAARIETSAHVRRQGQLFLDGAEVREAALEHRAVSLEREDGGGELGQPLLDRYALGLEPGADAMGDGAQA